MTPEWEQAARSGAVEDAANLLAAGADIDARDRYGQTALMIAASLGHADLAAWLVRNGADLNRSAKYGLTALMLAVIGGHTDMVRTLIDAGARRDARGTGPPGFHDKTALDLASDRDEPELISLLSEPDPRGS